MPFAFVILLSLIICTPHAYAEDVYQTPDAFLAEAFAGQTPEKQTFWITGETGETVNRIMERSFPLLRTDYWRQGNRTVWILEEIGKTKPITTGLVVNDGTLEQVKVLTYRESHGWEVRYPFFTDQFKGAQLNDARKLTQPIDNISGATMSVDALRNLGRLALFLHQQVSDTAPKGGRDGG